MEPLFQDMQPAFEKMVNSYRSTGGQTTENQLPPLRAWAQAAGHNVVGEFVD